ncbi:putative acyltransferase [Vibrio halioticoli NBRC 102217]|uniref:Putative acyltransferase n=1 Tax=Vibrio halioticoli NBRC 102217 TaxID=1219072 RepID=V5FMJ8_9VIBR|nr:acyltransferase [Vibrio halioticoli]GAD90067.1 putative acyltransferase [Vibrio halioticoli NBRC 102217]
MREHRLTELDALRGIAALAVVIFHYFARYNEIYGHENLFVEWSRIGSYGVHLFFIISGFVIFWTLSRTARPLDFLVSRFSRLYPAYWVSLIFTFSVVYIFSLPGREVSMSSALVNILMFQEYLNVAHVDGVYWTLTVELTFYFWIFLLYTSSLINKVEEIFSFLVIVSMVHSLGIIFVPSILYKVFILKYIPFFIAGICFYKLVSDSGNLKTLIALALSLFSIIPIYSFEKFFYISFFYLLFYGAVSGRLKFLKAKPLVFFGGISYSLYLIHQNIGYVIINKSYDLQLNPVVGIIVATTISILLAIFVTNVIEKPALRLLRNAYNKSDHMQRLAVKFSRSRA